MQIELSRCIGDFGIFTLSGNLTHDASAQIVRCFEQESFQNGVLCLHQVQRLNEAGLCGLAAIIIHFNLLGGQIFLAIEEGQPLKDILTKSGLSRLTRVFEEPTSNIKKVAQSFEL